MIKILVEDDGKIVREFSIASYLQERIKAGGEMVVELRVSDKREVCSVTVEDPV